MLKIYHNPACSKSRQTLALLRQRELNPTVIAYLEHPPSAAEIDELIFLLGIEPHDLLRNGEAAYRAAGLSSQSSRAEIVSAVASHPILLQRPIVVCDSRAAIGRPPERVLTILDGEIR